MVLLVSVVVCSLLVPGETGKKVLIVLQLQRNEEKAKSTENINYQRLKPDYTSL